MSLNILYATKGDGFGSWSDWRKSQGLLWHAAEDYAAPLNVPILAPVSGRVVYSGCGFTLGTLGYYTILDCGSYGLLFAHQDREYPELLGDVKAGDVIGYIGLTGFTTGPHTHVICSVKRFSNGAFDFTRDGGGTVAASLMMTGGYTDGRAFEEMSIQSHTEPGVWGEVTTRVTTRGEWRALDNQGINTVSVQVAGEWRTLDPEAPEWTNEMFPAVLYSPAAVFINRGA